MTVTPEVREAAGRLLLWTGGHVDYPGVFDRDTDIELLARAVLASVREDDGEPISPEWLLSVGFTLEDEFTPSYTLRGSGIPAIGIEIDVPTGVCWLFQPVDDSWDKGMIAVPKKNPTRGQVRRLLAALGLPSVPPVPSAAKEPT